ncbi:variable surface lipoprotein [Metamycoplasma auris]|uniref:Lipoprotein n=1 Tax=Metamycoplasma auris TaxID=51363 RepID=A0A2W7G4B9_9BACT|nr:variable surface lipoprotein [Metamycoplasma auris]PZV99910.1 hypothetical protein BCF89_10544 [Metamycoplasma auris]
MKKSNKLLLALGSISSLAALPLIAASCDKNDKSKEETKNNPATSEGTTTNSNSSSSASTSGESTTEREQGDQAAPSLGSSPAAPTPKKEKINRELAFWQSLGDFSWLGAEEREEEQENLGETAELIKQNSDQVEEDVKNNWGKLTEEDLKKAAEWSEIWESIRTK